MGDGATLCRTAYLPICDVTTDMAIDSWWMSGGAISVEAE